MQISYANDNVKKHFVNYELMQRKIGKDITRAVKKRINELTASENMDIYISTGLGKPHVLSGDLKGYISISLTANYRLIIKPVFEGKEVIEFRVCKIAEVKGVDDYHGGGKSNWLIS